MYTSHVETTISAAHHNGPPGHKCLTNHGHEWHIVVEFTYSPEDLDDYGWGPDFGKVKKIIDSFDHQDLNERMSIPPSAENFAALLYNDLTMAVHVRPDFVEVNEGKGNRVTYRP